MKNLFYVSLGLALSASAMASVPRAELTVYSSTRNLGTSRIGLADISSERGPAVRLRGGGVVCEITKDMAASAGLSLGEIISLVNTSAKFECEVSESEAGFVARSFKVSL